MKLAELSYTPVTPVVTRGTQVRVRDIAKSGTKVPEFQKGPKALFLPLILAVSNCKALKPAQRIPDTGGLKKAEKIYTPVNGVVNRVNDRTARDVAKSFTSVNDLQKPLKEAIQPPFSGFCKNLALKTTPPRGLSGSHSTPGLG